jgi:hypothetical protein
MAKQIFISYSSPDKAKADAICAALEGVGLSCWIAPRDLSAGTQWGGGIVKALEECTAVAVVFSDAANNSPQVAREMEIAVSNRRPLVPIRVADAQPTDDMHYFLGVSHWFDAWKGPIDPYLPQIVLAVRHVVRDQDKPWKRIANRLPRSRAGMIGFAVVGAVLLALLVAWLMKPGIPNIESPLEGRWQASLPDGKGGTADCMLDVQGMGQAKFSDTCPPPLLGNSAAINVAPKSGVWAPNLYRGDDDGTFLLQGGTAHGLTGAYKLGWFGSLTTRDDHFGEVRWSSISQSEPMKSGMDGIVPTPVTWPPKDMPGIARRARDYIRARWQPDAVLLSMKIELYDNNSGAANIKTDQGDAQMSLSFYSPSTQKGMTFWPMAADISMSESGAINPYGGALPDAFLDLPDAVAMLKANGMRAKQIKQAELADWGQETTAGSARMHGVEWMIDSSLDERFVVPAIKQP